MNNCINLKKTDFALIKKYFIESKKEFIIETTSRSTKIYNNYEKYIISEKRLSYKTLGLIQKIRKEVKERNKDKKIIKRELKYFSYNYEMFKEKEGFFELVSDLDLNSAYLYSAFLQEFISEKLFLEIKELKKENRLIVMGSLATNKNISYYNSEGKLIKQEIKKDDFLRLIWNNICFGIEQYLQFFIDINKLKFNKNLFLFYWVDNIYFNISNKDLNVINWIPFKLKENSIYYKKENYYIKIKDKDNKEFNLRLR